MTTDETSPKGQRKPPTERVYISIGDEKLKNPKLNILPDSSLKSFAQFIIKNKCKNIIVMTGAGISTSAGIPDFRTPGTGLYSNLQKYNLPYPEAIFDIDYFKWNPNAFYELSRELFPGSFAPTRCHHFIRLLTEKEVLLKNYTQNIDMLERIAGVPDRYLVESHGSFNNATCVGFSSRPPVDSDSDEPKSPGSSLDQNGTNAPVEGVPSKASHHESTENQECEDNYENGNANQNDEENSSSQPPLTIPLDHPGCGKKYTIEQFKKQVFESSVPKCECDGFIKPDIVFFGEQLPHLFHDSIVPDFKQCDALIVMGTSLGVKPFCELINLVDSKVPRLLINRDMRAVGQGLTRGFDFEGNVQKYRRDALFLGSCDEGVTELCRELGEEYATRLEELSPSQKPEVLDTDDIAHALTLLSLSHEESQSSDA